MISDINAKRILFFVIMVFLILSVVLIYTVNVDSSLKESKKVNLKNNEGDLNGKISVTVLNPPEIPKGVNEENE